MARTIDNDENIYETINKGEEHWYKVKFNEEGKANFFLQPQDNDLDVDLYLHSYERASKYLDKSTNGKGKDDLISEFDVEADKYYYIRVKGYNGSGKYLLRCKNYSKSTKITLNDWLVLSSSPTKSNSGRVVEIPSDAIPSLWAMKEGQTKINYYAKLIIGDTNEVNIGSEGELLDKDDRYWIAVGPKVMNPDFQNDDTIYAEDMNYGTLLDVVICDNDDNIYYIKAVVGDAKAHTYPNGIYQTGDAFPNGTDSHPNNNDGSIIEFMGKGSIKGFTEYDIVEIIVYDN